MGTATKTTPASTIDTCRFLSADEVIHLLKISRTTLFGLVLRKKDPLPSVKIGRSRRFPLDKVRSWMDNLGQ